MNIGKALTFAFKDKNWLAKFGALVLVLFVPVLNLAGAGYSLELLRRVMKGEAKPLPGWDGLGRKFLDGLSLFFVGLVYMLPVIVLACLPLSLTVIPAFLSGSRDTLGMAEALRASGTVLYAGLGCVFVLYALAFSLLVPAIFVTYGQTGKVSACFRVRDLFALIGRDSGGYFAAYGISLGVSLAASFVTGIVGGVIGWIPVLGQLVVFALGLVAAAYASLVNAHLFGQYGAKHKVGAPAKRIRIARPKRAKTTARKPARTARRPVKAVRKASAAGSKRGAKR